MSKTFPGFRQARTARKRQLTLNGKVTGLLLDEQASANRSREVVQLDEHLVAFHNINTSAAEQYRKLYVEILRAGHVRELRTLLISSAMAGEGKTTVALNLAITIASSVSEWRVLLVETDLRRPRVQTLLGTHPVCGLTDYLLGDVEYSQIFTTTEIPGLTVVHAGRRVKNPMALLSAERLEQFFKEIKSQDQYKYIIVDSSPILLASETSALMKYMDTAILVVHSRKTSRDMVSHVIEILGEENIIGCVFNAITSSDFYYYRQYYVSDYYDAKR